MRIAACYGHYGPARALVEAGALLNPCDWRGATALNQAKQAVLKGYLNDEEECKQTYRLLLEAYKEEKECSPNSKRADDMRKLGNQYYQQGNYEKAVEMYTNSIDLFEDYRAYGNRSAAYLKISIEILGNVSLRVYEDHLKRAIKDADKSTGMKKTYEKGYHRRAKGFMGLRDIPRAKWSLKEGLEQCPKSKALKEFWQKLDDLGVPDRISNLAFGEGAKLKAKLNRGWAGEVACHWCGLNCMDHPTPERCPHCACDTNIEPDQDALALLTMF